MKSDGSVIIDTKVDTDGFVKGTKEMSGSLDNMGSKLTKIGKLIAGVFAVKKLVDFGKECIELWSDLAEVQNVVDSVFTTMSGQVDDFARSAAQNFGLSETMAKQYAGTFGAMAKSFGFAEKDALAMSTTLTGLAGDVASFYNMTQDEAYTKLKSVFTGETESLKELGVVMTQTALDQYAMANGYGKTTNAMTEQEKVALRYQFVLSQLDTASGDFLRTSDGWANQVRVLSLQINQLKATIGQGLINIFTPVIKVINAVIGKLQIVAEAFKRFTELITGKKSTAGTAIPSSAMDGVSDGYDNASTSANNYTKATNDATDATKKAAEANKKYMSGLDEMSTYQENTSANTASSVPSGGGSGAGLPASSAVPQFDFGEVATGTDVVSKAFDEMDAKIKEFLTVCEPATNALKKLWSEGLSKLKDFTITGLKDFYSNYLVPIGKWTMGEGIPRFVNALNDGLNKIDFSKINGALASFWEQLSKFHINVASGLLWIWENVIVPFGTWVANEVVPRYLQGLTSVLKIINAVIEAMKPVWQWFWDNVLKPIATWTGGVFLTIWDSINGVLEKFAKWCQDNPQTVAAITTAIIAFFAAFKIASLISTIASFISLLGGIPAVIGTIISAINPVTAAIAAVVAIGVALIANWDKIKQAAKDAWNYIVKTVTGAWNTLKTKASNAFNAMGQTISGAWNTIKTGAVSVWNTITSTISSKWESLKTAAGNAASVIGSKFSSAFSSVKTTVSNALSGAFSVVSSIGSKISSAVVNMGTTIKTGLSNVFNGLVNILKAPINGIISVVNGAVRGIVSIVNSVFNLLNKIHIRVPSWVPGLGGKEFGFRISPIVSYPQIPYLATGAVIPPNAPFMAMLGDQKHGTNIETPEKLLRQIVREETGGNQGGNANYQFTANINRRVLFDEMIEEAKLRRSAIGTNPFSLA